MQRQTLNPSSLPGSPVPTRAYSGLETAAWPARAPLSYQPRAANDDAPSRSDDWVYLPPWAAILCGMVVAGVLGALLGGALSL